MPRHILLVEDDPGLREAIEDSLLVAGFLVTAVGDGAQALAKLKAAQPFSMIVSDVNMPVMDGHELLSQVRAQFAHIPMLLITAYGTIDQSVKAMQAGAVDYLVKPFEASRLVELVERHTGGQSITVDDSPVAVAPSSQHLLRIAARLAKSDSTALILGESGTGKEVLARYIHNCSPRANKPFVAINCAAIPESMLESILFGHEKGAYTGALSAQPGKFEQANGGTLLLDEISEMDMSLQAKLLRVLQEREVERLGGRKVIKLDVRVIATSNRSMQEAVQQGRFREDLYYRLSVLPLCWHPLRERREDIVPLAKKLLAKHATKQHRRGVTLTPDAERALVSHYWPGNVRELDNVMQRALILSEGLYIQPGDLALDLAFEPTYDSSDELRGQSNSGQPHNASVSGFSNGVSNSSAVHNVGWEQNENGVPPDASMEVTEVENFIAEQLAHGDLPQKGELGNDLKQREFAVIVNTIRESNGSRKQAAEKLGISPRTLRYKIAKFRDAGMHVDECL
ncbi:sigma-54 dependent transcriptional regulator [Marinibactrum halimedae]|nr:sigma-54 dependent transcriptional regulator [Marinibactrum halimedae]